uniref:Protein Smaug n=1 Tax=Phallusia mammillata TaxID=59560 RepID=A0A6F9DQY7_9ASCI|nr:protein Smaug homolog 2 [Phallusia mammillata]
MLFSDQVEVLAAWFKNWNECEQTVALYSLLKRVKKCQAKFLARCLEHFLNDCDELYPIEEEANNDEFVSRLFTEPQKSTVIDQLLSHLPLLRPGNDTAKNRYLQILPTVLAFAIERSEYLEESRQLLSYSLIHPAFDNKERHLLTSWMSGLDGRMSSENRIPSSQGDLSPEVSSNTNSLELGVTANGLNDWNDNNVVNEKSTSLTNSLQDFATACASQPDISSPSSATANSLPDTSLPSASTCTNEQLADGMADVKVWLKSLRLHKYDYLFSQMTYEAMMELTPDKLDEKSVTKGARNKIILSIKKLHERFKQLQALENEILGGGSLRAALLELKGVIQTPIKRFESKKPETDESGASGKKENIEEGDIPALYTKVMGKACTQLLVSKPDEENITLYMKLLERCLQHAAFTEVQKRRLRSWKQQVNKMYRSLPRNTRPPGPQRPQGVGFPLQRRQRTPFGPQLSTNPRPLNPLASPPLRPMGMGFQSQNMGGWYGNGHTSGGGHLGNIDPARKAASYDPRLGQRVFTENDEAPSEINTRLDSLCLSVAEHALADGLDGVSTL